ncbi:nuclear protein 1 [Solea senegalensis]|uniref:Nuclear protein 1 n=1 Tax=Solea senegalensis TaxID=28829 RepID=A0AAV6RIV2_SOLSE|nr:nuclear protein 1 [Solea senegalensis]
MSHVDVKNLKPTTFEEENYDEYEYYNLTDKYTEGSARKGRTKKEREESQRVKDTEDNLDGFSRTSTLTVVSLATE